MTNKSYWLAGIAVLIFMLIYEFIVHGVLLSSFYEADRAVWRTPEEAEMWCYLLSRIAVVPFIVWLYSGWRRAGSLSGGVQFGFITGAILGILWSGEYAYMRIPIALAWSWLCAFTLQGIGIGAILGALAKPRSGTLTSPENPV